MRAVGKKPGRAKKSARRRVVGPLQREGVGEREGREEAR